MVVQIKLSRDAVAPHSDLGGDLHEIASDIAYLRAGIVNVVLIGPLRAADREWVLVDAGVIGSKSSILRAAQVRFGRTSRPAAIVQAHGHFDHVGALEDLSSEWDVPVYTHRDEVPYLAGRASYPPPDAEAEGGIMPKLASLFPRAPVDVSERLVVLPGDGAVPPLPDWSWLHTPGHTPGHLSLWRQSDRTLIVGDAFSEPKGSLPNW